MIGGQYGSITNIIAKSSRLFYLQEKGIGYLPVFERELQDSSLGDAIQLGIDGILDRFDEIDYEIGNQHQMSLIIGDGAMLWFDMRRRLFMRLSFGGEKMPLSIIKGVDSFFYSKFAELEDENVGTILDSDDPLNGAGIVAQYDYRNKMGIMCFKYEDGFSAPSVVRRFPLERDFSIMFNNTLDKFIGFINLAPNQIINHNGLLLMNRQVRNNIVTNYDYVVGDEVSDLVDFHNYICILAYNSGGAPTAPSSDATHWVLTTRISDVHMAWKGDICKFFGKVYPAYLEVVIKNNDGMKMVVDNVEAKSNDSRFSDIYTSNLNQTGQDIDIMAGNKNYQYSDGSWWFNLPFSSVGARMSDSWLKLKMQVKNYVINPTVSTNLVKRIFHVKSSIRRKQ